MRIWFANLSVGSGVEYSGSQFGSWISEFTQQEGGFKEFKDQTRALTAFDSLLTEKPDVIVINDHHRRIYEPVCYYKKLAPKTRVIHLSHFFREFFLEDGATDLVPHCLKDDFVVTQDQFFHDFLIETMDNALLLAPIPPGVEFPDPFIRSKIGCSFHPVGEEYKSSTPWETRENLFCYLGNLLPHKMDPKFVELLQKTDIKIDCYGRIDFAPQEFKDLISATPNIVLKGPIPQVRVPDMLNRYKFFVMSHNGTEPFNISLLQAIKCGTIPLVSNDRRSRDSDFTWIDWAKGLYMGCNTPQELVENLLEILKVTPDWVKLSVQISAESKVRFDPLKTKEMFLSMLKGTFQAQSPSPSTGPQGPQEATELCECSRAPEQKTTKLGKLKWTDQ